MKLLEGKRRAEEMLSRVREETLALQRMPGFGAVLVGEDPASCMYVDLKKKAAHRCGMLFCDYTLPENASEEQVKDIVRFLNRDPDIDGILVQLPLPKTMNKMAILNLIDPEKDVDGLTEINQRNFEEGKKGFISPFSRAIMAMLDEAAISLKGKKGGVLANSSEFGRVVSEMLSRRGAVARYCLFSSQERKKEILLSSDIIVCAVGKPGCITGDMVCDGAVIIDGGIEKQNGIVRGDVALETFVDRDVTISSVPGGVGPITVACLMENVLLAAERRQGC